MHTLKYDNDGWGIVESDKTLDTIFDKYVEDVKEAYKPVTNIIIKNYRDNLSDYIVELIKKEKDFFNCSKEYRILVYYVLWCVSCNELSGFDDDIVEDLIDYTDAYGRVDQALNYIVGRNYTFEKLLKIFGAQMFFADSSGYSLDSFK